MKQTLNLLALLGLLVSGLTACADVKLHRVFTDHMVLQRDLIVNVWGWADPGEPVSVEFGGQHRSAAAGPDGQWTVSLAPMKTSVSGRELVVTGKNTVKLADVLVGDVWMVSGQSNAAFGLGGCRAPGDVSSANFPLIRYSGYWEHFAGAPQSDGGADWRVINPGSAGACSAIGFYFARKVYQETGIPIGILTCAVGGTEIECWMSPEAIYNYPQNADIAKRCRESIQEWERELPASKATPGSRPAYLPVDQPIGLDLAFAWLAAVRSNLKDSGTPLNPGFIELETWMAAARAALEQQKPVPPQPEFDRVGGWLLGTSLPDNLKRIPILPHPADRFGVGGHGWFRWQTLYNGMIHPLIPFTMKGMLWYQGENGSGSSYYWRFRSMVETMRTERHNAFPVYMVQLPNFDKASDDPQGEPDKWPATREQQFKCLQISDVGLAVTIDVGDPDDLHPPNKGDMGERLALWALAKDYRKPVVYSGPLYKGSKIADGKIILSFDSTGGGLMVGKKEGRKPAVEDIDGKLKRFAVAGADKKWHWADAVIEGKTVVVSSPEVPMPVAARYAYSMNPEGANLYNKAGLPAAPFRTDEWQVN